MAERDPAVPQSDDPDLQADAIRLLRIVGPLGRFNVADVIIPVFNMGDVAPRTVLIQQLAFRTTDIFTNGSVLTPVVNTIHADTGALPGGIYDTKILMSSTETAQDGFFIVEHRNAANAANLSVFPVCHGRGVGPWTGTLEVATEIGENERIRVLNGVASSAARRYAAVIFARRRT